MDDGMTTDERPVVDYYAAVYKEIDKEIDAGIAPIVEALEPYFDRTPITHNSDGTSLLPTAKLKREFIADVLHVLVTCEDELIGDLQALVDAANDARNEAIRQGVI